MEHPFFPTTTNRAEALRWLTISEKLLSTRDLMGSKSFATRARDSDPTLTPADQILAIVDTLLAGDTRIGNNHHDWYAVLRITPQQGHNSELIASQYRNLSFVLNPQNNKFPFAEHAFRLVVEAWSVISNPSRKSIYEKEVAYYVHQQQHIPDPFHGPVPTMPQNFMFFGGSGGAGHFSEGHQVHAQPLADPIGVGSTREQQNFMNFASGSSLGFGSGSVSKSGQEPVNLQGHQNYAGFSGNVGFASGSSQEQVNTKQKQQVHDYYSFPDKSKDNANVGEDVAEEGGDEEEEGVDLQEEEEEEEEEQEQEQERERVDEPDNDGGSTFWTSCPYCYYMYEYPKVYIDCCLRCQNCKRAFQGVVIQSPPPIVDGQYFYCWGFFPLGVSVEDREKNRGTGSVWTPFSPMFVCPQPGNGKKNRGARKGSGPRVYFDDDDDEVFVDISSASESDVDWRNDYEKRKKKAKIVRGKGGSGTQNRTPKKTVINNNGKNSDVQDGFVSPHGVEMPDKIPEPSKKGVGGNARKQPKRVAKNHGKLDLNVECSNETEEPVRRVNQENGSGRGDDDNIEGISFFEGLDEYFCNLPILNVVGDDKAVKAA